MYIYIYIYTHTHTYIVRERDIVRHCVMCMYTGRNIHTPLMRVILRYTHVWHTYVGGHGRYIPAAVLKDVRYTTATTTTTTTTKCYMFLADLCDCWGPGQWTPLRVCTDGLTNEHNKMSRQPAALQALPRLHFLRLSCLPAGLPPFSLM